MREKEHLPGELYTYSLDEIYDMDLVPSKPIIKDFLYSGLNLFCGAPKVGKSFMMADIAYSVAMGIPFFGHEVERGTVLYLALEDTLIRIRERMVRKFGVDSCEKLIFATEAQTVRHGLEWQIEQFAQDNPDLKLIIIDTLQKVREAGAEFNYANDYEIMARLKHFADKHEIAIMVVHHTRKMPDGDCFNTISGTNGLLGAADSSFVLQKEERTSNEATLDIVGRDQPDQQLLLSFDRKRLVWNVKEVKTELWKQPPDPLLEKVSDLVSEVGGEWKGTATELLEDLNENRLSANTLTRKLNVSSGRLMEEYGIKFSKARTHAARCITLLKEELVCDDCDDCVDILVHDIDIENTVITDATVTETGKENSLQEEG